MREYIAVIHQDEGSAYGAHFPDIPGCYSAADDLADLKKNCQEALALFFEGSAAPEARSLAEIKADPEVKKDLADGAFLFSVPVISFAGRVKAANITMDAGLLNAIDQVAKSRGLTRSSFLADVARRELESD